MTTPVVRHRYWIRHDDEHEETRMYFHGTRRAFLKVLQTVRRTYPEAQEWVPASRRKAHAPKRSHGGQDRGISTGRPVPHLAAPPLGSVAPGQPTLSLGDLIDRLSIENVRLWHLQNEMGSPDDAVAAQAARLVTEANTRRIAYRAEITRRLEGGHPDDTRSYAPSRARSAWFD